MVGTSGQKWAEMGSRRPLCCAYVVQDPGLRQPYGRLGSVEVVVVVQRRRGFGRVRRERSGRFSAAYVGPDLQLHRAAETFQARIDTEGWLAVERRSIDLDVATPGPASASLCGTRTRTEAWRADGGVVCDRLAGRPVRA